MDHALRCMVWDPAIVVHGTPIRHRDQPHSKQEGESRERGGIMIYRQIEGTDQRCACWLP